MNNRTEEKLKDLSGMQKAVSELLYQAWERGYKCCEAEHKEQTKKEPEFYVGDVVYYSRFVHTDRKGIIIGLSYDGEKSVASVYTRDFDVPQIIPLTDLTPTGQQVNVLSFFNKAFMDIQEVKKNET